MRHHIGDISGTGAVWSGQTNLGTASYRLHVYQDRIPGRSHSGFGEVPGLVEIEGTIAIAKLRLLSQATLHLQDGRKLDFQLIRPNGAICAQGGFY